MASSMSRRGLILGASGLAVAGTLARATAGATVDADAWDALRGRLRGALVLPGDPTYGPAKTLVDARFNGNTPAGVVQAAAPEDVRTAAAFAREHGLPIAARAGGHSFVGASATNDALIVDLRRLDRITVHGDLVTVGAGTISLAAQQELAKSGRALPIGTCPGVGLVGLTVGGGLGVDSRRYGMTCDRLVAADLVLPDGTTARASATEAPDLFWALRGAGGACGIVTELTYQTIPATAKDIVRLTFPGEKAAQVLTGWARWQPTADRAVYARVDLRAADGIHCQILMVCPAGSGPETTAALIDATTTPTAQEQRTLPHLDAITDIARDKPAPGATRVAGSDILPTLSPTIADAIVDLIAARARTGSSGVVLIEPLDGAITETSSPATAFPWRSHAAALEWIVQDPHSPTEAESWIHTANQTLTPHSAGAYLNHVEPTDTLDRCFGPNSPRVQTSIRTFDPDRRLRWGLER
ncbi:FAD-binding oxidoreductase [Nocardia sp. NPDC003482]